ncbi:MAG: 30S ribosomal protein S6 [Chloroflexi bacterium]|nr:30S ribosomal protein S6 [Chloroflexota bacterium]
MRNYELMFILQPGLEEDAVVAFVDSLQKIVTDRGGEIINLDRMGMHNLAYPINKHSQGNYVLLQFSANQEVLVELERTLKLSDDQMRYLITRMPETA